MAEEKNKAVVDKRSIAQKDLESYTQDCNKYKQLAIGQLAQIENSGSTGNSTYATVSLAYMKLYDDCKANEKQDVIIITEYNGVKYGCFAP